MVALSGFRLAAHVDGERLTDFRQALDLEGFQLDEYGPLEGRNFTAHLFVVRSFPHDARWAAFLREGFGENTDIPRATSPAALLIVEARRRRQVVRFAFPFGIAGRFLLAGNGYERGYGLRAALNAVYRRDAADQDPARLRSIDSKRRGATTVRARMQASAASTFEIFDVNQLRDVVSAATGVPTDEDSWGRRVSGSDAFSLDLEIAFGELGDLCLGIEGLHARDDYRDNFAWIDNIQPVTDPDFRSRLERAVLEHLQEPEGGPLELAPPEILDWERVSAFHYHYDRPQGAARRPVVHRDLSMADYLRGLRHHQLDQDLGIAHLRSRRIEAVDGAGDVVHSWPVWRCLVGELVLDDTTYVVDEGEFFSVRADYLGDLDAFVAAVPESLSALPPARGDLEGPYNERVAAEVEGFVRLDRKTVRVEGKTTAIEVCDLLTAERELIHVKRHLGSSDLSHLFAQGLVSADLLQMNRDFRRRAQERVTEMAGGRVGFDFFDVDAVVTRDFTITYAIVADWRGRAMAKALPFFSKVNLRNVATELRSRDFRVALRRVDIN